MIHEIATELAAKLVARGVPIPVVDGPLDTDPSTWSREQIVVEHDTKDSFTAPWSQSSRISKNRMIRLIGAKITVYAKSPKAGAFYWEHQRRAETILDQILFAMSEISALRKGHDLFVPSSGGFVDPPDLAESMRRGGAVYELSFTIPRGVFEKTWAGDVQPSAEVTGDNSGISIHAQNSRLVRIAGTAEEAF